jgi:lysophospholipase L1-like esterase
MKFNLKISSLLLFCFFVFPFLVCGQTTPEATLKWHDIRNFIVEGKGWTETANFFDRLPAKAEKQVRPEVWKLAQNSAGISVRFITDADSIYIRWKLRSPNLALPNMTAISVSGVDLYTKEKGKWQWVGIGKPDKSSINEQKIVGNMLRRKREFLLCLPLYNGVDSVEVGLPVMAFVTKAPSNQRNDKPIVFYGTSIVQGASASRAGMAYPSILGRKLNRRIINLGFSGNGKMEAEIAELLTDIDAAVYVIDCLPNLSSETEVEERTPRLIEILHRKRPRTPIILIENIRYPDVFIEERKNKIYQEKNAALRRVYNHFVSSKINNLYYIPAKNLIGNDAEGTIDGVHPTDVGFMRMASIFEPILKKALRNQKPIYKKR